MLEAEILGKYRSLEVIGASSNPKRPSHRVLKYLTKHGYDVTPVNPKEREILGKASYPNLSSTPEKVEVVDIFRKSEDIMPIIDEAIKIGAKAIWMQEGVINEEAADRARDFGLLVVMDRCMHKEHLQIARSKLRRVRGD